MFTAVILLGLLGTPARKLVKAEDPMYKLIKFRFSFPAH